MASSNPYRYPSSVDNHDIVERIEYRKQLPSLIFLFVPTIEMDPLGGENLVYPMCGENLVYPMLMTTSLYSAELLLLQTLWKLQPQFPNVTDRNL